MSVPLDIQVVKMDKKIINKIFIVNRNDSINNMINQIYNFRPESLKEVYFGTKTCDFLRLKMREISDLSMTLKQVLQIDDFTKMLVVINPEVAPTCEQNAFSVLMNARRMLNLPEKKVDSDGKSEIYNAVVNYLTDKKVGFYTQEDAECKKFMNVLVSVLWLIDGQQQKFDSVCGAASIPEGLRFSRVFHRLTHNDHVKKTIKNMKQNEIVDNVIQLEKLVARKFIQTDLWEEVLTDLNVLLNTLQAYLRHLQTALDKRTELENKQMLEVNRKTYVVEAENISSILKSMYRPLSNYLSMIDIYTPVNLVFYAPFEKRSKYNYIRNMKLDIPVKVYRTYKPAATFIWKLPKKIEDRSERTNDITIASLEKTLEETVIRDQIEMVNRRFGNNSKWNDREINLTVDLMTGILYSFFFVTTKYVAFLFYSANR